MDGLGVRPVSGQVYMEDGKKEENKQNLKTNQCCDDLKDLLHLRFEIIILECYFRSRLA